MTFTRTLIRGLLLSACLALPGVAMAGPNSNGKIVVHLTPRTTKNACGSRSRPTCAAMITAGSLFPSTYYAYVVTADGHGTGGLEFGIDYDGAAHSGVDIFSWSLCADTQTSTPGWPAPGTGNRVLWNSGNCQTTEPGGAGTGVITAAGYFYCAAYSSDRLAITPHPTTGTATLLGCGGEVDSVYFPGTCNPGLHLGFVSFGGGAGYCPCSPFLPLEHDCGGIGPGVVPAGSLNVTYDTSDWYWCANDSWQVTGNATIVGPANQKIVHVNVGAPGTFRLTHGCTDPGGHGQACCKLVQVVDPVVVQPESWSRIKAMYRP